VSQAIADRIYVELDLSKEYRNLLLLVGAAYFMYQISFENQSYYNFCQNSIFENLKFILKSLYLSIW